MPSQSCQSELNLEALARQHGTDKFAHGYSKAYETHFEPLRDRPITLVEIGVGGYDNLGRGGASMRLWSDYFPNARIYGIDVHKKQVDGYDRVKLFQGKQQDVNFLASVLDVTGPPDIVIDDGSHVNQHRNISFEFLFPRLTENGIYVIEDLHTSYWKKLFGGSWQDLNCPKSTMVFLKNLTDGLNHEYIPSREPNYFDLNIYSIHFYSKIAFIQKGRNQHDIAENDRLAIEKELNSAGF